MPEYAGLPSDIIKEIYRYLQGNFIFQSCVYVSKNWNQAAHFVSSVSLDCANKQPKDIPSLLHRCGSRLTTVAIGRHPKLSLETVLLFPQRIKRLELSFCTGFSLHSAQYPAPAFGQYFAELESLSLEGSPITNPSWSALPTQLTCLNIASCSKLQPEGVELILKRAKSLTELHVKGCHKLKTPDVGRLIAGNADLRTLSINSIPSLDGSLLCKDIVKCSQITELHIRALNITDEGLCLLADNCANLQLIELKFCVTLTNASIKRLVEKCTELRVLDLQATNIRGDDRLLLHIAFCLHNSLEDLDIRDCLSFPIDEEELTELLRSCTKLKIFRARSPLFLDSHLKLIAQHALRVEILHLQACVKLTDQGLEELIRNPILPRLVHVNASEIAFKDPEALRRMCSPNFNLDLSPPRADR